MASEVGICNRAIQRVGGTRIASLSDATKAARECNTAYEPSRYSLLRGYTWSFAIGRASLAADSAAPTFDPPGAQYTFPANAQRILIPNQADCDWIMRGARFSRIGLRPWRCGTSKRSRTRTKWTRCSARRWR